MIELNTVSFGYQGGNAVLAEVSLSVPGGSLLGLVGANGSGKSTLLSLLAGIHAPIAGSLRVADRPSPGKEKDIRSICRLVMQDADLQILGGTVEEDLLMGRKPGEAAVAVARAVAGRFNLLDVWDAPVQSLSWGMKRKLCLAAALLDEPQVLLLDEPFSGLDYPGIREMRAILRENAAAGLTQVVTGHDLEHFVDLVDTLTVLDKGRLVVNGVPEDVLDTVRPHGVRPPCLWRDGVIEAWDGDA